MAEIIFGALAQVFELFHTPRALEVLGDLAAGRSPYDGAEDADVIGRAIDCLRAVGAVTSSTWPPRLAANAVEITHQGRGLFERLVEIERMTPQLHFGPDQAAA